MQKGHVVFLQVIDHILSVLLKPAKGVGWLFFVAEWCMRACAHVRACVRRACVALIIPLCGCMHTLVSVQGKAGTRTRCIRGSEM